MADPTPEEQAAQEAAAAKEAEKKAADEAAAAKAAEDEEAFDKDRAMATIHKQRDEAKALRADLKAAKEKADKFDAAEAEKLSEQEKLARRAQEAETKAAEADQRLRAANLIAELAKPERGLVDARAAAKLIEGVEYADDGSPSNLTEILPAFLEQHPFLKGAAGAAETVTPAANIDGGAGRSSGPPPALTADELEAARKAGMTPESYAQTKGVSTIEDWERLQESRRQAAAS